MSVNATSGRLPVFRLPLSEELPKGGYGTEVGREAFTRMDARLRDRHEPVVEFDLHGVTMLDASCAREAIGNIIKKYREQRVFFVAGDLSESVQENFELALAKLGLSVLHRPSRGGYQVLGVKLKDHLRETLDVVEKRGKTTAKEVAARIGGGMSLPATNNRLRDLTDAGLLIKMDGTAESGGKEFLYAPVR